MVLKHVVIHRRQGTYWFNLQTLLSTTSSYRGMIVCRLAHVSLVPNDLIIIGRYPKNRPFYLYHTCTAAMLNLLDLRSIMGCPGGTRSVFTHAFHPKRELRCIFPRKKAINITSKHSTTIFFSHYNYFLGKLQEKLARKERVNTERVNRIVLMPLSIP